MGAHVIDLRLGRWQEVLADVVQCDVLMYDAPYTSRVMMGYRSGSAVKRNDRTLARKPTIPYAAITPADIRALADLAVRLRPRFIVAFNDHIGWRWLERAHARRGFYTFSPVVWHRKGAPPRFQGDGPADDCEYIMVARPRGKHYVGSLPGFYETNIVSQGVARLSRGEGLGLVGQKPLALMRALVRDYTSPGDLIIDPFCGTGTTALAAVLERRRCITAEVDPETHAKARARFDMGHTPDMFAGAAE